MMRLPANLVPFHEPGIVVAIQYWAGDQDRAFRLAALIAAIEPRYRTDVTLVLSGRHDVDQRATREVVAACNAKMRTFAVRSRWAGSGHPDGANGLWNGTMSEMADRWRAGDLDRGAVFTVEADGCPLSRDWIARVRGEYDLAIARGKQLLGAYMPRPLPHINGTLVCGVGWWLDHPVMHETPRGQAWDVFHRDTIMAAAARSDEIRNVYGATGWTGAQLGPLGKQASWLSSSKDDSAIVWAEQELLRPRGDDECPSCDHVHLEAGKCGRVMAMQAAGGFATCSCGSMAA